MGILQDKMGEAVADKLKDTLVGIQSQAEKTNKEVIELMEQIKSLLKEIQLCQNNNDVWTMQAIQALCDKTGVVLEDPLEK